MSRFFCFMMLGILFANTACTPVKPAITNQYTLTLENTKVKPRHTLPYALLISKPEAMAGYRTEAMLYVKKPFSLTPFAKNAWSNPPADMLYPLLIERFQESHAFRAISSSPYADKADYRLDTQLIALYQNFLTKKSTITFTAKITVTRISDNHVLKSRLIEANIPCASNTPYGGVIAANQAVRVFLEKTQYFVIHEVQRDRGGHKI